VWIFLMAGTAVVCDAKKQSTVVISSTESEDVVIFLTRQTLLWSSDYVSWTDIWWFYSF